MLLATLFTNVGVVVGALGIVVLLLGTIVEAGHH
jgi:hypothetical protein